MKKISRQEGTQEQLTANWFINSIYLFLIFYPIIKAYLIVLSSCDAEVKILSQLNKIPI